jgi:lipopolysaccharide/colanic/teichoic acid biosynthesis glycosyltransferase
MKRFFDLIVVAMSLPLILPSMWIIAVIILMIDGRPILFVQERVGRGGRPFRMLKFRTMCLSSGASLTTGDDARISRVGHFLRRFKLDELPQVLNVLKGEMSLVGPRPEMREFVALYTPEQRMVLELLPGVTDPASLKYFNERKLLAEAEDPNDFYIKRLMPEKIGISLNYAQYSTVFSDFWIILRTVLRIAGIEGKPSSGRRRKTIFGMWPRLMRVITKVARSCR